MTYTLLNDSGIRAAVRDYQAGAGGKVLMSDVASRFAMSGLSAHVNVLRRDGGLIISIGSPPGTGYVGSAAECALIGNHLVQKKLIQLADVEPQHVCFLEIYEFSDPTLGLALTEYRFGWDADLKRWTSKEAERAVVIAPGLDADMACDPLLGVENVLAGPCHVTRMSPCKLYSMVDSFFLEMAESTYLVLEAKVFTNLGLLWTEAEAKLQGHALASRANRHGGEARPQVIVAWKRQHELGHHAEWLAVEPATLAG